MDSPDDAVLDNPGWHAMTGAQAPLSLRDGAAARFDPAVSPFTAIERDTAEAWADLARLIGPGGDALLAAAPPSAPAGWTEVFRLPGLQMIDDAVEALDDPDLIELREDDAGAMLDLAARTRPGPYELRTREFGGYLGVVREGALVAMAGERMRPAGWTEISAVCTDDSVRGQGLGGRLVRAVATRIRRRGEVPMLHVAASNAGAIRLYEKLGFQVRRELDFAVFRSVA